MSRVEASARPSQVGDMVAAAGAGALVRPGVARWHALLVRPQRESAAEAWLAQRGVYAFHPVLRRQVALRGRLVERTRCYLPGYVFARFSGAPVMHRVTAGPFVTGAIARASGEWGVLDPCDLRAIHRMRARDAAAKARAEAARDRLRRRNEARPGDTALFRAGALAGMSGEVVALRRAGRVVLRLHLFGRETLVEAEAAALHKVA